MKGLNIAVLLVVFFSILIQAQSQPITAPSETPVPPLVSFSGALTKLDGNPLTGVVGVTFALYNESQGGAPLWLETQNVYPDRTGHYTVMLGSTSSKGLPTSLFVSGEARWLGVQAQGQAEQPRIMLLAVPYALKAVDAQTIGGLPASAFALAPTSTSATGSASGHGTASSNAAKGVAQTVGGGGTAGYVPEWTSATNLGNSLLFQSSAGNLGISTTAPAQKFEVDLGNLLAKGANNFTKSGNTAFLYVGDTNHLVEASYGGGLTLGAYDVPQALFIQDVTGRVGIDTITPTQKFEVDLGNLLAKGSDNFKKNGDTAFLYVGDTNHAVEAIWGGGLALGAYLAPQALFIHDNTGKVGIGTTSPQTTLDVNGIVNATTGYAVGEYYFDYGSVASQNAFLGFAGNNTTTGIDNTGSGLNALQANTTGNDNTATGVEALYFNTTGSNNTASGTSALASNTTGSYNTASGVDALNLNTTASGNTAYGAFALLSNTTGDSNTASGYQTLQSNTTGYGNTASGSGALSYNTTGYFNTASGDGTLTFNTTGYFNTASGIQALYSSTTANDNTAYGAFALQNNTTGNSNTASGTFALFSGTPGTGSYNSASGYQALNSNTIGNDNTASGADALYANTSGGYNTANGVHTLATNTTGSYNTALGYNVSVRSEPSC